MSDNTPEVPAAAVTPEAPETPVETPAQELDWKATSRKWESQSKANKTALDEAMVKLGAAEVERDTFAGKVHEFETKDAHNALLSEVSRASGVPASALRGDTKEALESHAEELKALIKPTAPVIPGQERSPQKISSSPEAEFVGKLFNS